MAKSERFTQLIEQNCEHHRTTKFGFDGTSLFPEICQIGVLLQRVGAQSVLDYGCGSGRIQEYFHVGQLWRVKYVGYDPAVPRFETLPEGRFDVVICTEVLEHIPEIDLLDWVLDEIFSKASKAVYITVPTYLSGTYLPNGENTHCTVRPALWWKELLEAYSEKHGVVLVATIKTMHPAQ